MSLGKSVKIDDEWVSPSELRNFFLKDPFLDYWMMYGSTPFSGSTENFSDFLKAQGRAFEGRIMELLKERFGEKIVSVGGSHFNSTEPQLAIRTFELMKEGVPIIYSGVLHNSKLQSHGVPDLLVRSDYLNQLVPDSIVEKDACKSAPKLGKPYHYRIVDIKFSTLAMNSDGKTLRNSKSQPAYKAQVILYTLGLGELQGYRPPEAYLLGRGYKYSKGGIEYRGRSAFDKLGVVSLVDKDKEYLDQIPEALQWIRDLRRDGSKWNLLPKPSRTELYPNLTNRMDDGYREIKERVATQLKDITMIWQCGERKREIAWNHGIYSWDDPRLTGSLLGLKKYARVVDLILDFHRGVYGDQKFRPKEIEICRQEVERIRNAKLEIYLDLEYLDSSFDPLDTLPQMSGRKTIFMIGVGYSVPGPTRNFEFRLFMSQSVDLVAEEGRILQEFNEFLNELLTRYPDHIVYHWHHAEPASLRKALTFHPRLANNRISKLDYLDLHQLFSTEPILIKGVYNFTLKNVVKGLATTGLIDFAYPESEVLEGKSAMTQAWKAYRSGNPMAKSELKIISDYNQADCRALFEIVNFIRQNLIHKSLYSAIHKMSTMVKKRVRGSDESGDTESDDDYLSSDTRYNLRPRIRQTQDRNRVEKMDEEGKKERKRPKKKEEEKKEEKKKKEPPPTHSSDDDDYSEYFEEKEEEEKEEDEFDPSPAETVAQSLDRLAENEKLTDAETQELQRLGKLLQDRTLTVKKILVAPVKDMTKVDLLEKYLILSTMDPLSVEYKNVQDEINHALYSEMTEIPTLLKDQLPSICDSLRQEDITLADILSAPLPHERKMRLIFKYQTMKDPNVCAYIRREHHEAILSELLPERSRLPEGSSTTLRQTETIAQDSIVSLNTLMELPVSQEKRSSLLEKYKSMQRYATTDQEYISIHRSIQKEVDRIRRGEKDFYEKLAEKTFPPKVRDAIRTQIQLLEECDFRSDSSEYYKRKAWIDYALKIPTEKRGIRYLRNGEEIVLTKETPPEILAEFRQHLKAELDRVCYGLQEAKIRIIDYVFSVISNPNVQRNILGIEGPPGVGKTALATCLANVLRKRFIKIPLGGVTDATKLTGHSFTYIGATPGEISRGLVEAKSIDPIIYLDEIDKVEPRHGNYSEVNGTLVHMLDPNHNDEFILDEYLGFPIDLSGAFFILTWNDSNRIDPIVRDRIPIIKVEKYTENQKVLIVQKHMVKELERNQGLPEGSFIFPEETIVRIISLVPKEDGVRKLKDGLDDVIRRLNSYRITQEPYGKRKEVISFPYTVRPEIVEEIVFRNNNIPINMYL